MRSIELELCEKCVKRLNIDVRIVNPENCILCSGLLWKIDDICKRILDRLKEFEFRSFSVGTKLEGSIKFLEKYIFEKYNVEQDKSIKYHFNSEISRRLRKLTNKPVKAQNADINIIFNPEINDFEINIKPLYIYGRYKKRIRNIPQTRWICTKCNGKGCEICNFTGKKYITSVEELILAPLLELTRGEDGCLHGAGREDVDARMLGNGRPFVIEIKNPRVRSIDLKLAESLINERCRGKVLVSELKFVNKNAIEFIKSEKFKKIYRVKVIFSREIDRETLIKALEQLKNRRILQRTPRRVEHRRADLVRERWTYDVKLLFHRGNIAVIQIEADSGLYIKELINGDEGRTRPSLTEVLNIPSEVAKLDVIEVKGGL